MRSPLSSLFLSSLPCTHYRIMHGGVPSGEVSDISTPRANKATMQTKILTILTPKNVIYS